MYTLLKKVSIIADYIVESIYHYAVIIYYRYKLFVTTNGDNINVGL
jgi:hypothetical protein